MKLRLVLLTEIIAPYRIPVFNALARHKEIDLHVVFLAETDPSNRQWHVYKHEIAFSYQVLPSWRTTLGTHTVLLNRDLSKALDKAGADVVLCGGYNYLASWQALRWAKRRDVPFLLWSESTADDRRSQRLMIEMLKRHFFSKCDGYVVPGASAKKYAQQLGAPSHKIFIAPNAVDNALFMSRASETRMDGDLRGRLGLPARYFLYVGRLIESKGLFDLFRAYASLGEELRSQFGLVIVGEGPLRAELQFLARIVWPGRVQFPGFVHRDELPAYYALAECFVFPTHSDPWGLVVNEAMACGLPIVCSEVAGCAADLVRENGQKVRPGEPSELACALATVASSSSLREMMSLRSWEIIQGYTPERCAAGIAESALATGPKVIPDDSLGPISLCSATS
jgi:glycosyltransferase involved in cell wall biosynthesis